VALVALVAFVALGVVVLATGEGVGLLLIVILTFITTTGEVDGAVEFVALAVLLLGVVLFVEFVD